jgi:hypothetical protein
VGNDIQQKWRRHWQIPGHCQRNDSKIGEEGVDRGSLMQDLSVIKTGDLSPVAKEVIESLLGRHLANDEEVSIWASSPHEAPTGEARVDAWKKLNQHLDLMASKTASTPADELEKLVDEVSDEVRHGRG